MTSTTESSTTTQARDLTVPCTEGVTFDGARIGTKFLSCEKLVKISTCTLNSPGLIEKLIHCADPHNINVVCIQEHRLYHTEEELKYQKLQGYELITCSARKKTNECYYWRPGFAFIFQSKLEPDQHRSIISHIVIAEFNSSPIITIICCYSPHNARPESEVDDFSKDLHSLSIGIPAHNVLLFCGDFNVKVGGRDTIFSFNTESNRNGEKLINFMTERGLVATKYAVCELASQTMDLPLSLRNS